MDFRKLLTIAFFSTFGDWMSLMALSYLVFQNSGLPALGLLTSVPVLAGVVVSPWLGAWADRLAAALGLAIGSCVMMLGALWHAAGENRSDQLWIAMGAYYARVWIRPFFDFTRALPNEVLHRVKPAARRLYGLHVQPPYVERWMWDGVHGRPKPEFREQLRVQGLGDIDRLLNAL